jgi:hypothetical protein
VPLGSALASYKFANQGAVDLSALTETERDDEAEENCASDGWLHLSWSGATHQPVDGDRRTQNVPNKPGCRTVYC